MILLKVRDEIQAKGQISLEDLCAIFQVDPLVMKDMLAHWLRKGVIRRWGSGPLCSKSCAHCKPGETEVYLWSKESKSDLHSAQT